MRRLKDKPAAIYRILVLTGGVAVEMDKINGWCPLLVTAQMWPTVKGVGNGGCHGTVGQPPLSRGVSFIAG